MALAGGAVSIIGIRELQASLRKMDGQSQKKLRLVFNEAAEIVTDDARPRVPVGPTGRAAGSVRKQSSQREARVKGGGAQAVYYPWLEFGGRVGRHGSIKRTHLGKDGRYMYPAYNKNRDRIADELEKGIVSLAEEAGLEVT